MADTVVVFSSGFTGHTRSVAKHIATSLGADLVDLKTMNPDLSSYSRVIIGTGIHAGKPYKPVVSLIESEQSALAGKDVRLFLLCMYNGERGDRQLKKVSDQLGISDAVYFNYKDKSDDGVPSAVDDYIKRVIQ